MLLCVASAALTLFAEADVPISVYSAEVNLISLSSSLDKKLRVRELIDGDGSIKINFPPTREKVLVLELVSR